MSLFLWVLCSPWQSDWHIIDTQPKIAGIISGGNLVTPYNIKQET